VKDFPAKFGKVFCLATVTQSGAISIEYEGPENFV
jgi:hypothetical protein